MNGLDLRLLDECQRDFPLVTRPYRAIAQRFGATEAEVIVRLTRLTASGVISRVGAVFAPGRVGAGALAALAAPAERLAEAAELVNGYFEVNHNYEREHRFNLWFVATAPAEANVRTVLREIEARAHCGRVLYLPMLDGYHVDLGFALAGPGPRAPRPVARDKAYFGGAERALAAALQDGIELVPQPFAALATTAGMSEDEMIATLGAWLEAGLLRRVGLVLRHRELGYRDNAMAVWDVPDECVTGHGERAAAMPFVTLAYRRARCPPEWNYNLYCMIHGKDRDRVRAQIEMLRRDCGLAAYPYEVLFSRRRFKQSGARYVEPALG